ncbi:MAG: EAL domain-containing protein [Betaproteobacteria bacterium]|nr:EAL domain-containing protein [Betaproteobacteria bacterium]
MIQYWDRFPFVVRLLVTATFALLVAGAAMLYISARGDVRDAASNMEEQLAVELRTLPAVLSDVVVIGDFSALQQNLDKQVKRRSVQHVVFRDNANAVIESRDVSPPSLTPEWFLKWSDLKPLTGRSDILVGGRNYGHFEITLTPQYAVQRAWARLLKHLLILTLAVGVDFLGIWLVLRLGLRPLRSLDEGSRALAEGRFDQRIPMIGGPELRHTIAAFNHMADQVEETVQALAASESRVIAILQSIGDGLIATDTAMNITYINPVAEALTGWMQSEALGRGVAAVLRIEHALTRQPVEIPVSRVLETGNVVGLANHTVLVARDGRRYHIADSAAPIRNAHGELVGVVMVFRDVSESYRLRMALEDSQARLGLALKGADLGLWDWNVQTGDVVYDKRWAGMLGYRLEEIEPVFASFEGLAHPEDLHLAKWALSEHMQSLSRQFEAELRMRAKNGEWRWVLTRGRVTERDAQGQALRVTGTHLDITERKRAEEALQLAAIAFETTEAIFITDTRGVILRVNHAFTAITGFTPEEVTGRSPGEVLHSGHQDAPFYAAMWQELRVEGRWEGEIWNRRKNGEVYPEWLSIKSARSPQGKVTHYVANFLDITEQKQAQAEIERLAYFDALTGLPNRRLLLDRVRHELAAARRAQHSGALLFIDLDHFKHINDARGHAVGDQVLQQVARRLEQNLRAVDTVARLGGDEFVVLLPELADTLNAAATVARSVADKLREALGEIYPVQGGEHYLGVSMGVTLFPADEEQNCEELLRHADTAMYRAKESGRNAVRFFEPQMQEAVENRLLLERELHEARIREEFRLHLQPQMDAAGRIVGAEALLRWQHPLRGLVAPATFIPLAEETGLIVEIGAWVLNEGARLLKSFEEQGKDIRLSVNVSPRQFREADFVWRVRDTLLRTGADPHRLTLEITEGMLLADVGEAIARMSELELLGLHFSIDDFGTGYSSLSYLKRLPLAELKIDRGFVTGLPRDEDDAVLVGTILAIARQLRLQTVAEGVETQAQLDYLRASGCDLFQGYHLGRPMPVEEFTRLLTL